MPLEYLRHILEEAVYLIQHSRGLSKADFLGNQTLRRAFVRSLEIVGEAAKKLPQDLRTGEKKVPGTDSHSLAIGLSNQW
ncbi:MAG: HepT-like ribonuclease domain-containing protein [Nitrospiraceae bacterium]